MNVTPEVLAKVAAHIKLVTHPVRCQVLAILDRDEASPTELARITGYGNSVVSTHLQTLVKHGLLTFVVSGVKRKYKITQAGRSAIQLVLDAAANAEGR